MSSASRPENTSMGRTSVRPIAWRVVARLATPSVTRAQVSTPTATSWMCRMDGAARTSANRAIRVEKKTRASLPRHAGR